MINKYTHLIITRFMCNNFIPEYVDDITTKEWENMSFDMAKRHIVATLENQTCNKFKLVFLVNNNLSDENIDRLYNLSDKLYIDVVKLKNFNEYIYCINTDYLITSRLDYDDHVWSECVQTIQEILCTEPDVKVWGINQGISLVDGEYKPHLMRNQEYELNKEGFFAPMLSLILKRTACKKYFDVYKLGFHTECLKNFINIQSVYMKRDDYKLEDIYSTFDNGDLYYIWIRHKHSATTIACNVTHNTNIKIDISKEELKERFGYEI